MKPPTVAATGQADPALSGEQILSPQIKAASDFLGPDTHCVQASEENEDCLVAA
ncbi:hypothetical protein [Aminobacter sp. MSH1]|uniref:hypothetical protein n=1 Tax=Aminobacter sp. MSH1 TaxID=374606 RepID=UPI00131EF91B|nr:hypothetical protein [Aminobacter sp. MSH1]